MTDYKSPIGPRQPATTSAGRMPLPARPAGPPPQRRSQHFKQLTNRLDHAQLEQTIAALHQSLPELKAQDAEATMRRMFERAKRWDR